MRKYDWIALVILFLLPFIVYFPVTAGQATFAGFDHTGINQPLKQTTYETMRGFNFPHWEPRLDRGLPIFAEGEAGIFYPLNILFFIPGDFLTVYNTVLLLCIVLGGVLFYWWLRRLGAGPLASFLAGIAHQWGATVNFNKANMNILEGYILAPLLMMIIEPLTWPESLRKNYSVRAATIALVFASILFAGQAQYVVYTVLFSATYIILRVIFSGRNEWPATLKSMAVPYIAGGILAVGVSAIQLLPTMELIQYSERAPNVLNEEFFTHGLWLNPSRLFAIFLFPAYHYSLDHFLPYLSTTIYVGPAAIMLAGYAIRYRAGLPGNSTKVIFPLLVSGLIFLYLAMGSNAPLGEFFTSQGILAQFRGHGRLGGYFAMAILVLMGLGLDTIIWVPCKPVCDLTAKMKCLPLFTIELIAMALLAIPFVIERSDYILTRVTLGIFIGFVFIFLAGYLVGNILRTRTPIAISLSIILTIQIFGFFSTSSETLIKRENWDLARSDLVYIRENSSSSDEATIFAIRTQASIRIHERIMREGLNVFRPGAHDHIDHLGSANAGLMENMTICNSDLPLELAAWEILVHQNLWHEVDFTAGPLDDEWSNLLWILGVNWLVTENPDLEVIPFERLENPDWHNRTVPFYIYRREPPVRPYAVYWHWISADPALSGDDLYPSFFDYLGGANVGSIVFCEGLPENGHSEEINWEEQHRSTVSQAGWNSPVEYSAVVTISDEAIFMVRDQWYPGWKVYVNGTESNLLKADLVFKAVLLPAGRNEVVFRYTPSKFITGLIISAISLLIVLGLLAPMLKFKKAP